MDSTIEKRCLYEILNLTKSCTQEEIRSSYRKLALQLHPDKLIKTGIPESQATSRFQELVNAYEVLSDPKERSWYDSHRSQILFSNPNAKSKSSWGITVSELFPYFSNSVYTGFTDCGKGFYKVYGELFESIYSQEVMFCKKMGLKGDSVREAPCMGNIKSDYEQVSAFYGYWLGFVTVMDFCWADEYEAEKGINRKSRRMMEDENKKVRKKARKEYIDAVRGLADFVKKRDKRVIEMQAKRNAEFEKKREMEILKKKEAERVKMEKARLYKEAEWTNNVEVEDVVDIEEDCDDSDEMKKRNEIKELYCVVCSKKFKSDKQWKNHEQSKKHKEKVAELRYSLKDEDEEEEEEKVAVDVEEKEKDLGAEANEGHVEVEDDVVEELEERFEDAFDFQEEEQESEGVQSDLTEGGEEEEEEEEEVEVSNDDSNEEMRILKQMISGRKNQKSNSYSDTEEAPDQNVSDNEEVDTMNYNKVKSTRKSRRSQKMGKNNSNGEAARKENDEATEDVIRLNSDGSTAHAEEDDEYYDIVVAASRTEKVQHNTKGDKTTDKKSKGAYLPVDKKAASKKDANVKSKNTAQWKKQKKASNMTEHMCDTCGEDFVSRNQLHKHLGSTGHASLKSR